MILPSFLYGEVMTNGLEGTGTGWHDDSARGWNLALGLGHQDVVALWLFGNPNHIKDIDDYLKKNMPDKYK